MPTCRPRLARGPCLGWPHAGACEGKTANSLGSLRGAKSRADKYYVWHFGLELKTWRCRTQHARLQNLRFSYANLGKFCHSANVPIVHDIPGSGARASFDGCHLCGLAAGNSFRWGIAGTQFGLPHEICCTLNFYWVFGLLGRLTTRNKNTSMHTLKRALLLGALSTTPTTVCNFCERGCQS